MHKACPVLECTNMTFWLTFEMVKINMIQGSFKLIIYPNNNGNVKS